MKIEVSFNAACKEPKIVIHTDIMTDEVKEVIRKLSTCHPYVIAGFDKDRVELLEQGEIVRIYAANQKVYAQTADRDFLLHMRLYEAEARLDKKLFVRISHSEIINLKRIVRLDLSISGTIRMELDNNTAVYVSRRYVTRIKQALGI